MSTGQNINKKRNLIKLVVGLGPALPICTAITDWVHKLPFAINYGVLLFVS